jgi:hypothetical protein
VDEGRFLLKHLPDDLVFIDRKGQCEAPQMEIGTCGGAGEGEREYKTMSECRQP